MQLKVNSLLQNLKDGSFYICTDHMGRWSVVEEKQVKKSILVKYIWGDYFIAKDNKTVFKFLK